KIIYQKSFGLADYSTKKKLDKNSVFDIGSIAKEFTAVGILMLKDKGLLSLSDSLGKLLPQLPYCNVTVQQLLTHTSGMPDGYDLVANFFDHNKIATNDDLLELLKTKKPALYFRPGEDLIYSGTGFNLLASIIEKISGESYRDYMNEKIFKPLGMSQSMVANFPRTTGKIPNYANGFIYNDSLKNYIRADSLYIDWATYFSGITGEGMIVTTAEDLLKWDHALQNNTLLSAATQKEMLTIQAVKKTFPFVQFGFGMRVGENQLGKYNFHDGWFPGYKSMHIHYETGDITVIVLSNNESQSEFIADGLATIASGKEIVMPLVHKETLSRQPLTQYTGKYTVPLTLPPYMTNFPVEIIERNNALYIRPFRGKDIELIAETGNTFFYGNGTDQQLIFQKETNSNTYKVWHIAWGVKKEIKKINAGINQ
ncbi:MAG TPA: serine hydrolase domain-containing protein, partial [Hanamia sp.]|nr:serine hydrolase domain-containing protein [Hanamia sp.]